MLLFWGGKGINNSANIFAFAVKNDKSTRKKSEKPRQYSRHRLPLQEIKSVSADRIEYTQAFLPVYRHPPPCLSGTCLNARPFGYIDSRYVQSASYLKLGITHPLPEKLIRDFCGQVEKVIVIEEGEPPHAPSLLA